MTYLFYHRELWLSQSRPTFWYRLRGTAASSPGQAAWSMWSCWCWKETGRVIQPTGFSTGEVVSFFGAWLESPAKDPPPAAPSAPMDRNTHVPWSVQGHTGEKMVRSVFRVFLLCLVPPLPPHWFSRIREDILWLYKLIVKTRYKVLGHATLRTSSQRTANTFMPAKTSGALLCLLGMRRASVAPGGECTSKGGSLNVFP